MSEIDYQQIADQLIAENERLRSSLVQIKVYKLKEGLDLAALQEWIREHYFLLIIGFMACSLLLSFFDTWRRTHGISQKA